MAKESIIQMISMMKASGYFVYDEHYVHIVDIEKYGALLKDSITGNFVEDILEDLTEDTIVTFLFKALSRFIMPDSLDYIVFTTTAITINPYQKL